MFSDSIYHVLFWSSHKSKRPGLYIGTAEIIAAGEIINEGKMLATTASSLHSSRVSLLIALYSKDMFTSLSTQRNGMDKPIHEDKNYIWHAFECRNVLNSIWIRRKEHLADPGINRDIPLNDSLRLALFDGRLPTDFLLLRPVPLTGRSDDAHLFKWEGI